MRVPQGAWGAGVVMEEFAHLCASTGLGVPVIASITALSYAKASGKGSTSRARTIFPLGRLTICSSEAHRFPSQAHSTHLSFMMPRLIIIMQPKS